MGDNVDEETKYNIYLCKLLNLKIKIYYYIYIYIFYIYIYFELLMKKGINKGFIKYQYLLRDAG